MTDSTRVAVILADIEDEIDRYWQVFRIAQFELHVSPEVRAALDDWYRRLTDIAVIDDDQVPPGCWELVALVDV